MNKRIIVSADCVCDLPENLLKKYSIHIIPSYIVLKGARFQDTIEVDSQAILEYLENDDEALSTMPPSAEDYKEWFDRISENDTRTVIHIAVSKKLSKSYENAVEAAKDMKNIHIIDSGYFSHGMGLFALAAADFAKRNATLEIILDELARVRTNISCSFVIKATNYVTKNSKLNATISNLINFFKIKPIVKVRNGALGFGGLYMGSRMYYVRKYIRKTLKNVKSISDGIIFVTVSDCSEEFKEFLYSEVTRRVKWKNVYILDSCASTLCNVGLGSVGLMFYMK